MLDKFIEDVKNKASITEPAPEVQYNPRSRTYVDNDIMLNILSRVSTVDPNLLFNVISEGYGILLNKEFIDTNEVVVARAFVDDKFIQIFSQLLMTKVSEFTYDEKICCNRLIYEYIIYKKNDKQKMSKLYALANILNSDKIQVLYGFGFENQTIMDLVISRYSTTNEMIAMKRVNCVIINSDINAMTEQNIINIYERLFDNLTPMFEGIMYDVWDSDKMRLDQEEIYGRITLAILTILENCPFEHITAVLTNFAQSRELLHSDEPIRINMRAIAVSDYSRVVRAVQTFETVNGRPLM